MDKLLTPEAAFEKAIRIIGSPTATARLVGKHQTTVRERLLNGGQCWPEHVLAVEAATGISRHDLRPDIYPREPLPAGAHSAAAAPSPASSSSGAGAFSPTDQEAR